MHTKSPYDDIIDRSQKELDLKTLSMIDDLLSTDAFSPYDTLKLIKYILDRYPFPLDNLPAAYLAILQDKPAIHR